MRYFGKLICLLLVFAALPIPIFMLSLHSKAGEVTEKYLSDIPTVIQTFGINYLYWSSLILAILMVVIMIGIILWPFNNSTYLLKQSTGELSVNRRAIESFVLSSLKQEPVVNQPKVKAIMHRRKIKVIVRGSLNKNSNALSQANMFIREIETDLKTCLGIVGQKQIQVKIQGFDENIRHRRRVT